jgi:hypothetical protein
MSIRIMSRVWDSGVTDRGELLVLLALADFCNDAGECWPAVASIARKARMDERSVRRILRKLEGAGWLTSDIGGGRHGCSRYTINPDKEPPGHNVPPDKMNRKPGQNEPETRTPVSPEPSLNHQEPSKRERGRAGVTLAHKPRPDGFAEFWERYPRKVGKGAAQKAYAKAIAKAGHDDLMFGLSQQMASLTAKDPQYIPHPATWLNAERWNDEPEPVADNRRVPAHRPAHRVDPALEQIARLTGIGPASGYGGA